MDESEKDKKRKGFPQMVDKKKGDPDGTLWMRIRFSRTYPQLINKLWIMWVKIYTVHTGTSIHNFFPVFLKKSLD